MGKFEMLTKYIDSFSVDEFQSDECLKIMKNFANVSVKVDGLI